MLRLSTLTAVFLFLAVPAFGEVIQSTPEGGAWGIPSTWIGGEVPDADDDVLIAGPVIVAGTEACSTLEVLEPGTLTGSNYTDVLLVGGSVHNDGAVEGGPNGFFVHIGGDLTNDGAWSPRQTTLTGMSDRSLSMAPDALLETHLLLNDGSPGDLILETPVPIRGNVDVGGGRLILQPDCPLTLLAGGLSGEILCNGNEIRFESYSYLSECVVDAAVLVGEVNVGHLVQFTGGLTVMDIMQNQPSGGNSHAVITGDLINNGLIRNNSYGFTVALHGDLICNGAITCSHITMDDEAVRKLAMGPDGDLATALFLPEFGNGTLVADTPLQISGGINLGIEGALVLTPGSSILMTERAGISGGTLYANGNEIRQEGTGSLNGIILDQAVLAGTVQVLGNTRFTGGLTVQGTLQNWEWDDPEIEVEGILTNEGLIRDFYGRTLSIVASGDLANQGTWQNASVVLRGDEDQHVGAGADGIDVPDFVLDSRLDGSGHQWFRDGTPIDGETEPDLVFATVGPDDYGTYHCEADGGAVSRTFVIAEGAATGIGPPVAATGLRLEQNHPNPFRRATDIAFQLPEEGHVRLAVYDAAGCEVSVLLDREMAAGRHAVEWRPERLARGVFFYRLAAGGGEVMRKALRLR